MLEVPTIVIFSKNIVLSRLGCILKNVTPIKREGGLESLKITIIYEANTINWCLRPKGYFRWEIHKKMLTNFISTGPACVMQ